MWYSRTADRISGEITRIGSDKLFLRIEAMGKITIDKNFIDTFSTDEDIEIKTDDDVIQLGGLEKDEHGSVRLLNSDGAVIDSILLRDIQTPAETEDPVQWEACGVIPGSRVQRAIPSCLIST